ncbi:hypothetical protein V6N12_017911 [Hibiscus sabdariffa]|uniref:Uncharacterized protein n=1 Tax=Hibiscus sabdariffa TaxID=183260 RepID=A0ABR2BKD1_9ROSI
MGLSKSFRDPILDFSSDGSMLIYNDGTAKGDCNSGDGGSSDAGRPKEYADGFDPACDVLLPAGGRKVGFPTRAGEGQTLGLGGLPGFVYATVSQD